MITTAQIRYSTFVFLLCTSPALAQGQFSSFGPVDVTCAKYLQDIAASPRIKYGYEYWVAGFVTGTNYEKGRSVLTDSPAHTAWLKLYCKKNPLTLFIQAAIVSWPQKTGQADK